MELDEFYTPTDLAKLLVSYHTAKPNSVVDFCAGGGELLAAAEEKWKNCDIFALDCSEKAVEFLRHQHSGWHVFRADFSNDDDLKSKGFCPSIKFFDLVLLNPPFSCKGASRFSIFADNQNFHASTAMYFVSRAMPFIGNSGTLLAILPASACFSEKDSAYWNYLTKNFTVKTLNPPKRYTFGNKVPNVILISITSRIWGGTNSVCAQNKKRTGFGKITIFRGKLSMPKVAAHIGGDVPLIHSSNLRDNKISNPSRHVIYKTSEVIGPAILFPRVGNVSRGKIVKISQGEQYVLSDCVIAVKCENNRSLASLYKFILQNWDNFSTIYNGTGAKYTTIGKVKNFFS